MAEVWEQREVLCLINRRMGRGARDSFSGQAKGKKNPPVGGRYKSRGYRKENATQTKTYY